MLKKHLLCTTAAFAALASTVPANASSYIKGFAGLSLVDDEELGSASGTFYVYSYTAIGTFGAEIDVDNGFVVGAALGWDLMGNWDIEAEFAYRNNDINAHVWADGTIYAPSSTIYGSTDISVDLGDIAAMSLMANAWYEFDTGNRWTPFVGVGMGWGKVEIETQLGDTSDSGFAYQVGAGVNYALSPTTSMGLEYRYFAMADDKYSVFGGTYDYDYTSQAIMVSMRVHY